MVCAAFAVGEDPVRFGLVAKLVGPGTNLTGQNEVVIVAVTANQAEVIRWAQLKAANPPTQDRGPTAIAVVLRSPKDYVAIDASGSPVLDSNGIAVTVVPPRRVAS